MGDDAQAEFLRVIRLAVMFACECHEAFGEANESDSECPLVDHRLNGVGAAKLFRTVPKAGHQQRELLGEGCLLEVKPVVQLAGGDFHHIVELLEEAFDAFLLIAYRHAFYGDSDDVDCGEADVTSPNRCLFAVSVLKHACAASHGGHLIQITFGV